MKTHDIIHLASTYLNHLRGKKFNIIDIAKPISPEAAINLVKIISKLSPLVGNMIEFNTCDYLNKQEGFTDYGRWIRQDPGFPDNIFLSNIYPTPGFEIKAWFPLATEITARFKDSQNHFLEDQTYVALLAWLPEFLIFGKPQIIGIKIISGGLIAQARDMHYHNPPNYIVLEPEDTKSRTINLQQTNTNGYIFQGNLKQYNEAKKMVDSWGVGKNKYFPTPEYQNILRSLLYNFPYRLDTNFAKMNRIQQLDINEFKQEIYNTSFKGLKIGEWRDLLKKADEKTIKNILYRNLNIFSDNDIPIK